MYYVYIIYSSKSKSIYVGYTKDLKKRLKRHNYGEVESTSPYIPWKLVGYTAFVDKNIAKNFEQYLKTGSGKAFLYKRLINAEVLKNKDSSSEAR